jgi:hypothetical protein
VTDALIVSSALDTNGQNARYVRAAAKHGKHMKIVNALAIGNVDPGGVVGRLQEAAGKHPEVGLRIRSAHKQDQYFQFQGDLRWGPDAPRGQRAEVKRLAMAADIIHLNNSERGLFELGMARDKKPMLLHHHGSLFRNNPERMLSMASARKMVQAVSTIDLQRFDTRVLHWLPTAYDVKALRVRQQPRTSERIRIGHFPTNRGLKHTDLFIRVVRELIEEGVPIELVPGEFLTEDEHWLPRWTWDVAMDAKRSCDIVYDQLMFGYGCNSVEAWAMGKPVIAGADEWTLKRMGDLWGDLPFERASEDTLKAVIRKMVKSAAMREDAAQRGLQHVMRYHDELPALEKLAELYHDAMVIRRKPRIQGKAVTFISQGRHRMVVDDQTVEFRGGSATVTDEEVVRRLREFSEKRPAYGITEAE